METKSLAQTNSVHNYFNAFHRLISPVVLSLTVIVSRSRIYANIGHGFSMERTEGTPGFWWCGRYGMHCWG